MTVGGADRLRGDRRRPRASTRSASSATRPTPSARRRRSRPRAAPRTDVAAAFNPNNRSYHPVVGAPHLRVAGRPTCSPRGTRRRRRRGCTAPTATATTRRPEPSVPQGPHGSTNPYMLPVRERDVEHDGPDAVERRPGSASTATTRRRSGTRTTCTAWATTRRARARRATRPSPHGSFRPGLIALTTDPAPYNKGASRITAFTPGVHAARLFSKSNCSTLVGLSLIHVLPRVDR